MSLCPCNSNKPYNQCCSPYIDGSQIPTVPEALMRSRYTAYTQANVDYIESTMKGVALKNFDKNNAKEWAASCEWLGLQVNHASPIVNDYGQVEFIARFKQEGKIQFIHELSDFHFEKGRWYYIAGTRVKVGRNDLCPCGSGKKYKSCSRSH